MFMLFTGAFLLLPAGLPSLPAQENPGAPAEELEAVLRVRTQRGGIRSNAVTLTGRTAGNLNFRMRGQESGSSVSLGVVQELVIHQPPSFAQMDEALAQDNDNDDAAADTLAQTVKILVPYTGVRGSNAGELIGRAVQIFLAREKSEAAIQGLEIAGYDEESAKPGTDFALMQALLHAATANLEGAARLIGEDDPESDGAPETGETPAESEQTADDDEAESSIAGVPLRELLEVARGRLLLAQDEPDEALDHFARVQVLSIPSNPWYAPAMFYSGLCYRELPPVTPAESATQPKPAQQILQQMQRLFPESAWTVRLAREIE